jgi:hypothetical protein
MQSGSKNAFHFSTFNLLQRYGYETENLQSLALQLGCKARSLNGDVRARTGENDRNRANTLHTGDGHKRLSVGILSSVADLVATLKNLVAWMDKYVVIFLVQ